jgi:hypothetical protein
MAASATERTGFSFIDCDLLFETGRAIDAVEVFRSDYENLSGRDGLRFNLAGSREARWADSANLVSTP